MKKIISLLCVILVSIVLFTAFKAPDPLVGRWKGKDKGDIGFLGLDSQGFATFEFNGETLGGKEYDHQGTKASMKYEVNRNITPNTIDFIIVDNTNKEELGRLRGLIELSKNGKELKMTLAFGGGPRPTNFEVDSIIFYKVK